MKRERFSDVDVQRARTKSKYPDGVVWTSTQGKVTGSIKKKLTSPTDIKTHHVAASPDDPQWLVESAASGKVAAHKPAVLKWVKAK